MKSSALLRFLFLLGLAVGQAELLGGTFRVSPMQLFLGDGSGSALVTIYNEGDQPVRFQISADAWLQSESGDIQLGPTTDILFFPKLVEVGAHSQRNVRVATSLRAGDVEKTYRLFFDELPPAPVPGEGAKVNVVTKMGIPVFLTPQGASATITTSASAAAGTLRVDVENEGNAFASLQQVTVSGLDSTGSEIFASRQTGWYLLAKSRRRFEFPVDEASCTKIAQFTIEAVYVKSSADIPEVSTLSIARAEDACGE